MVKFDQASRSSSRSSHSEQKKQDEPKKLVINVKPTPRERDPEFENKLKDLRGFKTLEDPDQ